MPSSVTGSILESTLGSVLASDFRAYWGGYSPAAWQCAIGSSLE